MTHQSLRGPGLRATVRPGGPPGGSQGPIPRQQSDRAAISGQRSLPGGLTALVFCGIGTAS